MATILKNLPFLEHRSTATPPGELLPIRPYQIIVWVSITDSEWDETGPNIPRFPALLDTGMSHNFAIREEELIKWEGLDPRTFLVLGNARLSGLRVNMVEGKIWLSSNEPGSRDQLINKPPFWLEMAGGIAVYPRGTANAPRLPLLGLRGLRRANLQLFIDCQKCMVSLQTPRRYWIF